MRAARASVIAVIAGTTLLAAPVAHADRPFAIRFTANDLGSITFAANTLMTCPDSAPTCASARLGLQGGTLGNNNGYAMTYVDVDGPGNATFNSSTATLSLPQDAFVLFAALYWAGDTSAGARGAAAPTPSARGTVLLRVPGAAAYSTVSASTLDTNETRFSGFADVTDTVRQAGSGAYTAANLQSGKGEDRYGAWDLVVAYRDPTPTRCASPTLARTPPPACASSTRSRHDRPTCPAASASRRSRRARRARPSRPAPGPPTRPMAIRRSSIPPPIARSIAWARERPATTAGASIPARPCA